MTELLPYDFDGHQIRIQLLDGEPWWHLADVCAVLEVANPRDAASRLDEDQKMLSTVIAPDGGSTRANFVSESGLYAVIFTSRTPQARVFRRWVTGTVLPAIRGGKYMTYPEALRRLAKELDEAQNAGLYGLEEVMKFQGLSIFIKEAMERQISPVASGYERLDVPFFGHNTVDLPVWCTCGRPRDHGGYVYAITTDAGPFKVGYSRHPETRLRSVVTEMRHSAIHKASFVLDRTMPGTFELEKDAHRFLDKYRWRASAEWFIQDGWEVLDAWWHSVVRTDLLSDLAQ